jgi:serine/threonine-protein kinase
VTSAGPEFICGYKVLRELGSRTLSSFAAIDPKPRRPEDALCVIERLARDPEVNAEAAAEFMRDAKRLSQVRHPNLVRVRDVVVGTSIVLLVSDWVEGEVYADIARAAAEQGIPIPLAGGLRVVVDLLEGLSALHEVRDAKGEPLRIVHAEVAPRNIVVGIDGRSVLVHPLHAPPGPAPKHAPDVVGYLAPEVLLGDQTADQRADVYGAGVLLWEALTGQRMHAEGEDAGEIVMRLLGGKIEAPCAPVDAPWAAPLAEAARKAVSPDPTVRFANATEMLADVRRVVGARLAPKLTVSALVEAVAGARIRGRSASLGVSRSTARLPSDSAWTTEAPAEVAAEKATPLDAEATKPPPSVPPPASSRPRASPSWGKLRTPSSPPRSPDSGSRLHAAPSSPPSQPVRLSEPPTSADVVEVIEMEVPPDKPSHPRPPPVPRRRSAAPPLPTPLDEPRLAESKTDLAALVSAPVAAAGKRARWTVVAACTVAVGAIVWMLVRSPSDTRAESPAPPGPSAASSAPSPAPAPPAPATTAMAAANGETPSSTSAHAANAPSPFDPPADDRPATPPPRPAPGPAPDRAPMPVARPAPPPAAPAPASSSTHAKKPVYDPMGI